jgi:hypothetical protein
MKPFKNILLALISLSLLFERSQGKSKIVLHVITHSHLDAGWVYDVDQCYVITKVIFTNVFEELLKNPVRKYTVGDLYFF